MTAKQFIDITHPETNGKARVTLAAFEKVWEAKGWQKVPEEAATEYAPNPHWAAAAADPLPEDGTGEPVLAERTDPVADDIVDDSEH